MQSGELRGLLGLANYVSRFIPNYVTIVAPLHILTTFHWVKEEQSALRELKDKLTKDVMAHFDPTKKTKLLVDASPVGIGAVLTQEGSKDLTDVETRESQTEKEALAIVWGIEHFHHYLFGAEFTLTTVYKPLEVKFNNPKSKPPGRTERWRLLLHVP